ncbi:tetratricopeptide repeat protein [Corallococcus exercitus]|uniref:tetratricopeptide repeat protein n=1 Tax=Corallococcus exercitus TaxID=2316736 RepID=UPI0035D50EF2
MTKWFMWMGLTMLTGSPLLSLALLAVLLFAADRFTLQLFPSPMRAFKRWQRAGELAGTILTNTHDRRARAELADIRLGQKRYQEAVDLLRPNLDAGDDDVDTLYLLGVAYLGAGDAPRGELLLTEAERLDADYRQGSIDLERGRFRLQRGELKGAQEALERFLQVRQGSVEGRVLLSRVLDKLGLDVEAKEARDAAWREYALAPRFQKRRDRWWAYRARPSRPLTYAAVALVMMGVGAYLTRYLPTHDTAPGPYGSYYDEPYAADDLGGDDAE